MMQTVDHNQISTADDGRVVPTENGNAGENGSDAESREQARREWKELISSEKYRALFSEQVSEIVRKRLKGEGESRAQLVQIAQRLGLDDPGAILARLDGLLTPVQRNWQSEQDDVREKYPEFLLERELQNPAFSALLDSFAAHPGVSLTNLYELFHLEQLTGSAARAAAEQTAAALMGAVQIRHARPHENGLVQSRVGAGAQASRLTRAQRAVLAERAAKGEKITF